MCFAFFAPQKTKFGAGVVVEVGEEVSRLGGSHILLVTDPGIVTNGIAERVAAIIREHAELVEVFDGVVANPMDDDCASGASLASDMKADLIIGLGGGSSMDTAKAIAVVRTHGGKPSDYFGADTLTKPIAPLICVPTTAGTGSEVTPFAVITDSKTRVKMNILDPGVVPTSSFVDPELTVSMPASLTAATGMDALTHAVEAYTCKLANPVTDALALEGCGDHRGEVCVGRLPTDLISTRATRWRSAASSPASLSETLTSEEFTAWPKPSGASTTRLTVSPTPSSCRWSPSSTCPPTRRSTLTSLSRWESTPSP